VIAFLKLDGRTERHNEEESLAGTRTKRVARRKKPVALIWFETEKTIGFCYWKGTRKGEFEKNRIGAQISGGRRVLK